jgi:acyl transferase domain-containing protein/acyl carrier protein
MEVGPQPVLLGLAAGQLPEGTRCLASLHGHKGEWQQVLSTLGTLYAAGMPVNWTAFYHGYAQHRVELPTYAWEMRYFNKQATVPDREAPPLTVTPAEQHDGRSEISANLTFDIVWLEKKRSEDQNLLCKNLANSHWVIFSGEGALSAAIIDEITKNGGNSLIFNRGKVNQKITDNRCILNINNLAEAQEMLFLQDRSWDLTGVLYLWNEKEIATEPTIENINATYAVTGDALFALQLVQRLTPFLSQGFILVTYDALPVTALDHCTALLQAPLIGLIKSFAYEAVALHPKILDLSMQQSPSENAREIIKEILFSDNSERQVAIRAGHRYVPRFQHKTIESASILSIDSQATYLITGGLGDLGLQTAFWLVQHGARHLILMSRSAQRAQDKQAKLHELESTGCTVSIIYGDIASTEDISHILCEIIHVGRPLRGIVHAAGIPGGYNKIDQLTPDALMSTLRPKVIGTWNLYQQTKNLQLDFFLCFSSIASVWGATSLGAYTSANSFLDAFTPYARGQGFPSFTINWGPWSGEGMASSQELASSLEKSGIELTHPHNNLKLMEQILSSMTTQITVANIDWSRFLPLAAAHGIGALFETLFAERLVPKESKADLPPINSPFWHTPQGRMNINSFLKEAISRLLDIPINKLKNYHLGLFDLGMDSVLSVKLISEIKNKYAIDMISTAIFEHSNIASLTDYIISLLSGADLLKIRQPATFIDQEVKIISQHELENMTDRDALKLLKSTLNNTNKNPL